MTDPVRLHRVIGGAAEGPPLLLLPSLGSALAMWDPQVAELGRRFRLIRTDLRGHGRSPAPPGPYSFDDLGGDVLALLDELGVERTDVCGLSIGAMVAMWLAATAPERVGRLILCCTSARFAPAEAWVARAATVRAEGTSAVADAVVERWFTPAWAARHAALVRRMRAMIAATPAEGYAGCCDAIAATDLGPLLPRIASPTRVIAGAEDVASPPDQAERIAALIPGSDLVVVADAAHLANVEQPARMSRAILDHLRPPGHEEEP